MAVPVIPPGGPVPPPPLPDSGGLLDITQGMDPGKAVAVGIMQRLRPVWKMVGDLISYMIENPDLAPAAKSIINMAFGTARGMKGARQRAQDAFPPMPIVPPPGGPPVPPAIGGPPPIAGLPLPPTLANRTLPF